MDRYIDPRYKDYLKVEVGELVEVEQVLTEPDVHTEWKSGRVVFVDITKDVPVATVELGRYGDYNLYQTQITNMRRLSKRGGVS